jgi:hypothetical protein
MGSSWDGNANGGGGGDSLQGISCPSNWLELTLGIGPFSEVTSNGKRKVMDEKEKGDAGFDNKRLTHGIGPSDAEEERGVSPSLSRIRNDGSNDLRLDEMIASRRESGDAIKRMRMSDEKAGVWSGSSIGCGDTWLVVDLYDKTRRLCEGVALINVRRRLLLRKIFSEEWRSSHSEWILRAADGDLLVYSSKSNGSLRVLNPFTMESSPLHNICLSAKRSISSYMTRYHDDVAVHLKFDSIHKTFEVTMVIGNHYLVNTKKELFVLIYKSAAQVWEIRRVIRADNVRGAGMTMNLFPKIFVQNNKIYCFKIHGESVVTYDLNGDNESMFHYNLGRVHNIQQVLGIVMYKGRITMVCTEKDDHPDATDTLIFYRFDELGLKWRSEHAAPIVLPHSLFSPQVICCGGDYIWLIQETNGYVNHIICIDLDKGDVNMCPDVFQIMSKARDCLSFCPST